MDFARKLLQEYLSELSNEELLELYHESKNEEQEGN